MSNKPYSLHNLNQEMRDMRIQSDFSQIALGQILGRTQKQMSEIENGLIDPSPELAINWFTALGAFEHVDLVHYIFDLHPLAAAPIDPRLNEDLGRAILNLKQQIQHALDSIESIEEWISDLRPGQVTEVPMNDFKELYDLCPGVRTTLYALNREFGINLKTLSDDWTRKSISQRVAMPRYEERKLVNV
ncbi:helix-turn-helix transcriptional regulator [uncultured Metabacillus sp.]|uniref:helix-turn-helix domain-containing protein n=1 Tax=uncultured Metabacillus sp. TaxID=2860135 RepID=UPI00261D3210|nr:helix-turn-helix transcriptional regulator [uncultured Metabacillus sp.]